MTQPKTLAKICGLTTPQTLEAALHGGAAFVGVNRSTSRAAPAGVLRSVDLATRKVTASCDLGGQPDSVAISAGGDMIAVAIENERDEDVNDGALPQLPGGVDIGFAERDMPAGALIFEPPEPPPAPEPSRRDPKAPPRLR